MATSAEIAARLKDAAAGQRMAASDFIALMRDTFRYAGLGDSNAGIAAEVAAYGTLHGSDAHGAVQMPLYITGLLDGTIDVGLANLWMNGASNKIGPTQGIINLQASGKPFHYVIIDKPIFEKTRNERGVPYRILDIPAGTLPLQTQAMAAYANPDYVAVHKDFPEDAAYEYVRLVIEHLDDVNKTGGIASIFTREFLPHGIDNMHPGAARAYREAGLLK